MTERDDFARFFDVSPCLFCTATEDGSRFERLNPAWERTLGWSRDELRARPFTDFIHPDDLPATFAMLDRLRAGEAAVRFENRYRHEDGRWVWLSWHGVLENGRYYGSAIDVTEPKRLQDLAETALRLTERVPVPVAVVSAETDDIGDLHTVYANPAFVDMTRPTLEEHTGRDVSSGVSLRAMPPRFRESPIAKLAFGVARGAPDVHLRAVPSTDGTRRLDVDVAALPGHRAALVVLDVTAAETARADVEAANAELRRANASALAVNAELEAFSYAVSHDLRAPLRAIHGFAEALAEEYEAQLDATARDYLTRVRRGAVRMGALIDELLELSRATTRALRVRRTAVAPIVESIVSSLREREPGRAVDVVVHDGVFVDADPPLLRIVLENLLGNAWKFTRKTANARVEVALDDGALVVRDNGAGFDPAHAGRLFGAFQRLHAASDFEGSGVGLATVRRVMNKHGGTVTAVAEVGKGATLRLMFPPRQRVGDSIETDGGPE